MKPFTFIDLFAWIWGFHKALHDLWWICVWVSENDKFARITYEHNYKSWSPKLFDEWRFLWDIRTIEWESLPRHNIMCGWFPCQAFSIAWYQKGFDDDRGNLFFDIARLADYHKPDVLFLENVKNLKSHDWWKTLSVILATMKELWYYVHSKVLNTCEYGGLPQNRERVYIIWFREEKHFDNFSFPLPIEIDIGVDQILENKKVDDKYYYNGKPLYEKIKDFVIKENTFYQRRRQYVRENKRWVCPTLTANMGTGWHNVPIIKDKYGVRKLTPIETFRLQWFIDDFSIPEWLGDNQLYKQAWNAVSVNTVRRIWMQILKAMDY